jgi:hypothetical protein
MHEDNNDFCNCEDCVYSRDGEQMCPGCGCLESDCPCGEDE